MRVGLDLLPFPGTVGAGEFQQELECKSQHKLSDIKKKVTKQYPFKSPLCAQLTLSEQSNQSMIHVKSRMFKPEHMIYSIVHRETNSLLLGYHISHSATEASAV